MLRRSCQNFWTRTTSAFKKLNVYHMDMTTVHMNLLGSGCCWHPITDYWKNPVLLSAKRIRLTFQAVVKGSVQPIIPYKHGCHYYYCYYFNFGSCPNKFFIWVRSKLTSCLGQFCVHNVNISKYDYILVQFGFQTNEFKKFPYLQNSTQSPNGKHVVLLCLPVITNLYLECYSLASNVRSLIITRMFPRSYQTSYMYIISVSVGIFLI